MDQGQDKDHIERKRPKQQESDSSVDSSGSGSSSSSSSSSGEHSKKHHHKRDKHDKHDKHGKHHKHHKHHHHHHDKKRRKKDKKIKGVCTDQYGKYGIIKESDRWSKQQEFFAWLSEVKVANRETLGRKEEADLWATFIEDFNTATLPDKKYYDLTAWERKCAEKAAKHGYDTATEKTVFNDEADRKKEELAFREKMRREDMLRALAVMDQNKQADMLRQQELRSLQQLYYKSGDVDAAKKIGERLRPGHPHSSGKQSPGQSSE